MSDFDRWLRQDEMAIAVPPHDFNKFIQQNLESFKTQEQLMVGMIQNADQLTKWVKEFAGTRTSYIVEEAVSEIPSIMYRAIRDLGDNGMMTSRPLTYWIESYLEAQSHGWIKDIHDAQKYQERMTPYPVERSEYKGWTNAYFTFRKTLPEIESTMETISPEDYDGTYLPSSRHILESSIKKMSHQLDALYNYIQTYYKFTPKIRASSERMQMAMMAYYNSEKRMPAHRPYEFLFHASINVPAILRDGMKTRAQVGLSAAGGGPDDLISTTADLAVAKAIVDGIHEIIQIARGQMSYNDVRNRINTEFPPEHINNMIDTKRISEHPLSQTDRDYERDRSKGFTNHEGERYHVLQAYKMYLMTHPHRYDPLFWGVKLDDFANIDEKAVGILSLKTDMSKVKEYLPSMEEFRIPPEAIVSMKQVPYVSMYQRGIS